MTSTSDQLHELGERYFRTQHSYDPYNATLLGLNEFDHLAGDPSAEASHTASIDFARIADELQHLDTGKLSVSDQIDFDVLTSLVWGAQHDARHSLWASNVSAKSYVSRQGLVFQAVPAMTITDHDGADRYLSRMAGLGRMFRGLGHRYVAEANAGRLPTAIGVHHAIEQLEGYLGLPLDDDALLKPTQTTPDDLVRSRAIDIVSRDIRPAMAELAAVMRTDLLPRSRGNDRVGILEIPGGEAAYLDAVKRHTTTDRTPPQIHQAGLDILSEMRPRWRELGQSALGESDFATLATRMREDVNLRFQTRQQILDVAEQALARAEGARDRFFPPYRIPECVVEEINPLDAQHAALAYYRPPSVDGSRPGAHCLLATDPTSRYSYEYEALAFHESSPGHHLQLATAQTLDIQRYRRYLDTELCGFIEGWGLYAEQLADEMGLYTNDLQRLGMLSFAALRASRLVVDTGLHYYGWSREQAMEFMWENTVTTEANVRNEIDRYIAWPGQALAYMTGRQEILRLRGEAQVRLGSAFSMSGFHGAVLGNGAVPLSVLERIVGRWSDDVAGVGSAVAGESDVAGTRA